MDVNSGSSAVEEFGLNTAAIDNVSSAFEAESIILRPIQIEVLDQQLQLQHNGEGSASFNLHILPDELPADPQFVMDVLRCEVAPLKVWRTCAVEYHRQGYEEQFELVLNEVVDALRNEAVESLYKVKEEYTEGITDIYLARAAHALGNFSRSREPMYSRKVVENLNAADKLMRINEYSFLIKGFYEILQGNLRAAEDHFRTAYDRATRGQNVLKKKYLFGSLVGMGLLAYQGSKYPQALEFFVNAVQINCIASGISLRMAIAVCSFKLGQFDRARFALEKCFMLDPSNSNLLVLMALVELVDAKKDRTKRLEFHRRALEYSVLAHSLDPVNALALNLLAHHYFHSWKHLVFEHSCYALSRTQLLVPCDAVQAVLVAGNQIRLNEDAAVTYTIISVRPIEQNTPETGKAQQLLSINEREVHWENFAVIELATDLSMHVAVGSTIKKLEVKELAAVERFASQALVCTLLPAVRAESNYLLGKVAHTQRNINLADALYLKALQDSPDMAVAAFGAAQIFFSKREFEPSLELFERVLAKHPDDKDTQAYVILLKSLLRGLQAQFDKLKEIAPGFQFEADLWLRQAQLRQDDPATHHEALKCYLQAKECIGQEMLRGGAAVPKPMPAELLSNIAVLHHSLGRLDLALVFMKQTLAACKASSTVDAAGSISQVFASSELDGVFYDWSETPVAQLQLGDTENHFVVAPLAGSTAADTDEQQLPLSSLVSVDDEVVIGDVKYHVSEIISESEFVCTSAVRVSPISGATESAAYPLFVKRSFNNFNDDTITYSFNLARLLEDDGQTATASEIYIALMKQHPSFVECYLRLSLISSDMGKLDEASIWLSRALTVNQQEPEATICLGDLYSRSANLDDAKKCYEKICSETKNDARSMLSLGNFYFWASMSGGSAKSQLKESYKFFYNVLRENPHNAFAANGLGMVLVQKNEVEAAKEVFTKAREAHMAMPEHICTNLAHVYVMQNRLVDAERLYQTVDKDLSKTSRWFADKSSYLNECVAHSQFRQQRFVESSQSLMRAAHLNPSNLRVWYNLANVGKNSCTALLKKTQVAVDDIEYHQFVVNLSKKVLDHLGAVQFKKKVAPYDRHVAASNATICAELLETLEERLFQTKEAESKVLSDRQRQAEEHEARIRDLQEKKERGLQEQEERKEEMKRKAQEKRKQFEEMKEKWATAQVQPATETGGDGKAKGSSTGKKRSRNDAKAKSNKQEDFLGDDEDEDAKLLRMIGAAGDDDLLELNEQENEINFGSSDDESTAAQHRAHRDTEELNAERGAQSSRRSSRLTNQGVFDSDEEDNDDAPAVSAVGNPRKRLRRSGNDESPGLFDEAGEDEDDDIFGDGRDSAVTDTAAEKQVGKARPTSRVIADSDEEL